MVASVVINVSSSNVDVAYDYIVPEELHSLIKIGCRVKVPFGNSNRTLMGYVVDLKDNIETTYELKSIVELIDLEPVITKEKLELAKYIKEDTLCPLIRILNLMVPEILHLKPVQYLNVINYNELDANLADVLGGKNIVPYSAKLAKYSYKIKKAIEQGDIKITYDATGLNPNKTIDKYVLNEMAYFDLMHMLKPNVQEALSNIRNEEPLTVNEISERIDISTYMVKKVIKLGILEKISVKVSRIKNREISVNDRYIKNIPLYDDTLKQIQNTSNDKPILWIPSNIKETEAVLERIVRENTNNLKNTLIVVPDILSSIRISSFIRKKTKLSVACINSELSKGEFYDYSEEIKNESYRVVVTTPKGSLIEYPNVQTVVLLDGESDNYFNDQSPRYDLKKVMYMYSKMYRSNYVIHSYSPNLDEYVIGIKGIYNIIDHRDLENNELKVEVVNLKDELMRGNNTLISHKLLKKIKVQIAKGKQTLLITNRKNYSNFVMCRSCGEVIKCPRCDVAMQYSKKNELLMCPACSTRVPMKNTCSVCGEKTFREEGIGMEHLVSDFADVLPDARVITIDNPNYEDFSNKMIDIEDGNVDIIIATDVYSRNVIDNNIGLVVVMNLDEIIGNASFTTNERAYNMLSHIRVKTLECEETEILIQTYQPNSLVLTAFLTNDYKNYIKQEIANRKALKNTPFYNINRIFIKGKYEDMFKEANNVRKIINELAKGAVYVIGPTYNKSHQAVQLIVKHQLSNINNIYQRLYDNYQTSQTMIIIDKYPRYL